MKLQKHRLEGLAALLLFGVFAGALLSVLFTGADLYRRLTRRDQAAYEQRVCAQYFASRVRQAENAAAVTVEAFGDGDALVVSEETGGEWYSTRVYQLDGCLMELYCAAANPLPPSAGQEVMPLDGLRLTLSDGLLEIGFNGADGEPVGLTLSLRGGKEAAA